MLCGRPAAAAYPNKPHYTIAADKKQRENGPGRKSGVLSGRVGCGRTAAAGGKISARCRKKSLDEMRRIEYDNGSESEGVKDMSEEYGNDLVTVLDDEGNEHQFEVLDAIENDDGRYVALLPVYTDAEAEVEGDGELVILEVVTRMGRICWCRSRMTIPSRRLPVCSRSVWRITTRSMRKRNRRTRSADRNGDRPAVHADCCLLTLLHL